MAGFTPMNRVLKDGTPCLLRGAEESDAPALLELAEENAREYEFTTHAPDEVDRDRESRRQKIREYKDKHNWLLLIACCDRTVVGGLSIRGGTTRRTQHHGMLGISVASSWRRRGVGRALMNGALHWATSHPTIEKVNLCVLATHRAAIALYRSVGFIEEGRRVREIRLGEGQYADDLIMACFVKPVAGRPLNPGNTANLS